MTDQPQWDTACATAHRELGDGARLTWIKGELFRVALKLKDRHGTTTGMSGMALGGDLEWAEAVLFADLRLHAAVPFRAQADRWPRRVQERWAKLLAAAAAVGVVSETNPGNRREAAGMLHARNDWMLDRAQAVVALADPGQLRFGDRGQVLGGTWSCVDKAVKRGLPVIWLNPATQTTTTPRPETWARILTPPTQGQGGHRAS